MLPSVADRLTPHQNRTKRDGAEASLDCDIVPSMTMASRVDGTRPVRLSQLSTDTQAGTVSLYYGLRSGGVVFIRCGSVVFIRYRWLVGCRSGTRVLVGVGLCRSLPSACCGR